jgi:muramoyltetrapeptide carboxypeptidase
MLAAGLAALRKLGLEPRPGPCLDNLGAGNPHGAARVAKAAELHTAFMDPEIRLIVAADGGVGSASLLPLLDMDMIKANPKPLLAFSDGTALQNGLHAAIGLVSFNGVCASLDTECLVDKRASLAAFNKAVGLLMSSRRWGPRPLSPMRERPRRLNPGVAGGRALGGNLTSFVDLLGTPWMPDTAGAVLFLEDINEDGLTVSSMLWRLKLAGVFAKCAGVVFGTFEDAPNEVAPGDPSVWEAVADALGGGPPCLTGVPFGHRPGGGIVPIGAPAVVDADQMLVSFDYRMG